MSNANESGDGKYVIYRTAFEKQYKKPRKSVAQRFAYDDDSYPPLMPLLRAYHIIAAYAAVHMAAVA